MSADEDVINRLPGDCGICGFAAADWERRDAIRLLNYSDRLLDDLVEGAPDPAGFDRLRRELEQLPADARALDEAHLLQAAHRMTHILSAAGRLRWAGTAPSSGRVAQVNSSGGGVPKTAVPQALVGRRGLSGDRQDAREHHGSPYQALCLWSVEVVAALRSEGHPVGLGNTGENISLEGLDWAQMRPGMRLAIGEVLAETTSYSTPCRKNAQFFAGGDFRRMAHSRHPGWSRLYARVLLPGTVLTGAPVVVEP